MDIEGEETSRMDEEFDNYFNWLILYSIIPW